jgi:pilus assembly protein CpaF
VALEAVSDVANPGDSSRLGAYRDNIGVNPTAPVVAAPKMQSGGVRRSLQYTEQVWGALAGILGLIQTHEKVSRFASKLELTRDAAFDMQQRRELHELLTPVLMTSDYARIPMLSQLIDLAYDELCGISVLGELWRDDEITEILVDAWDRVTVERNGELLLTNIRFRDEEHARKIARDLALKVSDRALTPATPLVTAELPGARVTFAIGKVVKSGLSISMRKFRPLMQMHNLLGVGALSEEMRAFLADCVRARANIIVSGGTGTGKTTFVNALSEFIPDSERVITIEDAYELKLSNTHWVAMQTKEAASSDDAVVVSMADLLVLTLRMRPDRIIVGEIREPKGAAVMLQAANTGHDGTMSTIHANSADRALNFRLVGLARTGANMDPEVAAAEVSSAVNVVIQVERRAKRRYVADISVVDPSMLRGAMIQPVQVFSGRLLEEDGNLVTRFERTGGVSEGTELALKLEDSGLLERWRR